jgi:hypothetical protein
MSTVALVPADRQFISAAASGFTSYGTYTAARDAAITASAGASSAAYITAEVIEEFFGPTVSPSVNAQGGTGPGNWIIQAASSTTYLPKATAESTAAAASTASAPYYVARLFQTVTGP